MPVMASYAARSRSTTGASSSARTGGLAGPSGWTSNDEPGNSPAAASAISRTSSTISSEVSGGTNRRSNRARHVDGTTLTATPPSTGAAREERAAEQVVLVRELRHALADPLHDSRHKPVRVDAQVRTAGVRHAAVCHKLHPSEPDLRDPQP